MVSKVKVICCPNCQEQILLAIGVRMPVIYKLELKDHWAPRVEI